MGNYIDRTDVKNRLRRSYEQAYTPRDASAVDTDLVDADIELAEGEVDGYLATRYAVPVTDSDAQRICKAYALAIVEELAYSAIPGDLPKGTEKRTKSVRENLNKISNGDMTLGSGETPTERTDGAAAILVDGPDAVMGRDNLRGF